MKKTFLFLAALAMSAMTWAETKTLIIDGSQLTSTATTAVTDFTYGGFTIAMSDGAKVQASSGDNKFEGTSNAILIGKSGKYIFNKTPFGKITKFELYANKGASAKVSVGVLFSTTAISEYATGDNTYTATLSTLDNVYDCSDKIPEGAKYFWYQVTNANNSQVMFRITYEEGTTPQRTLQSIYVDGTAEKLEYFVGEEFDPAGLKVMGKYDTGDDTEITAGIVWTIDPETLALGTTSVAVTAQYKDFTSEAFTVNNIVVKEKVVPTGYAGVYTSDVELTTEGGTSATAVKVKIDGTEYDAIKAGTGKVKGACVVSIPAATKMLHFHAAAWNKEVVKLDVNGTTYDLVADAAIAGSGTSYELQNDPATQDYFTFDPKGATTITFTASADAAGFRFVLFGVNAELEQGVVAAPSFEPTATDFDQEVTVTLTAEEGAEIFYALNEEVTSMNAITYTEPIKLTATTTIYAVAKKDGKESAQVNKTYTLIPAYTVNEIAAITPTGQKAVLVLDKDEIVDIYTGKSGDVSGLYFQATEKKIELYNQSYAFPKTWEKGGKVSGRVIGEWTDFKGQWELKIATEEIEKLSYTAPGEPTGINNAKANAKATKTIVNGQIVIIRDNKTYNVLGF